MNRLNAIRIDDFLTDLSFPPPDTPLLDEFHASTKMSPASGRLDGPWIARYLTDPRAILETSRNRKNYFFSERIGLPEPAAIGGTLGDALRSRSTAAGFTGEPLSLAEVSTILSAAVRATRIGVMDPERDLKVHFRPYASGGGLYPIEVYPILLRVEGEPVRVTHYDAANHLLTEIGVRPDRAEILGPFSDYGDRLDKACLAIVLTAVFGRTTVKYGSRGYRFALLEAGEIAQNLSLCAEAMGLRTLPWGGYFDDQVADLLKVNGVDEAPVHCLTIGWPG